MGLFNKKADPISQRAKALNAEIAALEAKIKKLHSQPAQTSAHPRVRSTALPHGPTIPATTPTPQTPREPIFEHVDQNRLQAKEAPVVPEQFNQLGVKKYDLVGLFGRMKNNFRGRPAANPRLVSYLAAGSIQGLRPLRYEKRVARNRFFVLTVILLLVLCGIISMFWKHH
jgi:cell division protein FtsB